MSILKTFTREELLKLYQSRPRRAGYGKFAEYIKQFSIGNYVLIPTESLGENAKSTDTTKASRYQASLKQYFSRRTNIDRVNIVTIDVPEGLIIAKKSWLLSQVNFDLGTEDNEISVT